MSLVTTVSPRRSRRERATWAVVEPLSRSTASPSATIAAAVRPMRSFSCTWRALRTWAGGSGVTPFHTAPPWVRRSRPSASSRSRSRRMVISETCRWLERSATRTVPDCSICERMI